MNPDDEMKGIGRLFGAAMVNAGPAFTGMAGALRQLRGVATSTVSAALSTDDMRVLAEALGIDPPDVPVVVYGDSVSQAVAPAHTYVADLTAEAAATLDALAPALRAVVTWPDGERQEWAIPAGERAAVEAALAASGAAYTIEGGAG